MTISTPKLEIPSRDWQQSLGATLEGAAFVGLLCTFAFATLSGGATYWWALFGLRVLFMFSFGCWLLSGLAFGKLALPRLPITIAAATYFIWAAISTSQSQYTNASLEGLADIGMFVGAFFLTAGTATTENRRRAWWGVFMAVAMIHGAYAIAQANGLNQTPRMYDTAITSTYYNPNHYAGFLDLATPTFAALALLTKNLWTRVAASTIATLMLYNNFLNDSWGGRLAVALTLLGLLNYVAIHKLGWGKGLIAILLTTITATIGIYAYVQSNQDKTTETLQKFQSEINRIIGLRLEIYKGNLAIANNNPIFGVGPHNFTRAFTPYRSSNAEGLGVNTHGFVNYAHSDFMQIAAEMGWVGVAVMVSVLGLVSIQTNAIPLLFGMIGLIGHGIGEGNFTHIVGNAVIGFLLLGLQTQNTFDKTSNSNNELFLHS